MNVTDRAVPGLPARADGFNGWLVTATIVKQT